MQNIPVRTPEGRVLREAFDRRCAEIRAVADLDYSEIEQRLMDLERGIEMDELDTIRMMTQSGWKMTVIGDHVTMLQRDSITLTYSPMLDAAFPYSVENGADTVAKFSDMGRAGMFAVAEHHCQVAANRQIAEDAAPRH